MKDEIKDIIDCILKFDSDAIAGQKAIYFDIIQRDLKKAIEQPKTIQERIKPFISDEESVVSTKQFIIDNYGNNWLRNDWTSGDVMDAMEEYASIVERRSCEKCAMAWTKKPIDLRKELKAFLKKREYSPSMLNWDAWVEEEINRFLPNCPESK